MDNSNELIKSISSYISFLKSNKHWFKKQYFSSIMPELVKARQLIAELRNARPLARHGE